MPTSAQPEPAPTKPKRRWWQFSIETLLGLMLVLGGVLALFVTPELKHRRAVTFVNTLGGYVEYGDNDEQQWLPKPHWLRSVEAVDLAGTPVTDAGLVQLKVLMPDLLDLSETQVGDAGLVYLKEIKGVDSLSLRSTQVSDAGMAHLKDLTGLEDLDLSNTQVSDAGLQHLKCLTRLRRLDLSETQVTVAGVVELRNAVRCEIEH